MSTDNLIAADELAKKIKMAVEGMTAKFLLGLYGYRNTTLLEGFLEDWKAAGLPIE